MSGVLHGVGERQKLRIIIELGAKQSSYQPRSQRNGLRAEDAHTAGAAAKGAIVIDAEALICHPARLMNEDLD
jgi:hypothetical protein